jgi:hypothetical protein
MAHARAERFQDRAGGSKVGIGDPERDDVAPRVAVPAQAPRIGALDRRVKVYFVGFDC